MRIEAAASAKPSGILLREKDLSDAAYAALAAQCRTICATQDVPLIVNRILSTPNPSDWLQLPFPIFQQHRRETLPGKCIGVSVHALEEACTAQKLGADFLMILTGESPKRSDVTYIARAVAIAKRYFSTIGLEVYPMNVADYQKVQQCGADFVTVFQETYQLDCYSKMHPGGPKRCFPYRVNAQERALMGGMRGVGFGVLLGLSDFRKDMYAAGVHAMLLQKKYPHAEIALSFPRLRPYKNHEKTTANDVHETQLLQMMLASRIFLPFASFTISTRERAGFRDHILPLAATKISAGVNVGIGGHTDAEQKGDAQFEISDGRSLSEIHSAICAQGMQPVYTDYLSTGAIC